ncbi:hypothetical protein L2E82_04364 [Cichorium intybus]|uniref:Uncharacterized protein n=1 Tax=Cichorium intybus TaxID=13427 RepID=A0ACB9H5B7_CICIN|nr:hypothetical protein L2E82_04364 [Cichorium intybus]
MGIEPSTLKKESCKPCCWTNMLLASPTTLDKSQPGKGFWFFHSQTSRVCLPLIAFQPVPSSASRCNDPSLGNIVWFFVRLSYLACATPSSSTGNMVNCY